jgi:dipeptide transport system ATP-binding protein
MGLVLITHDMGVVAETSERVIVQYAGRQVEEATTLDLFADPHHPYTSALLAALPERATEARLPSIPGMVPGQADRPNGCLFAPRCAFATPRCSASAPVKAAPSLGRALCFTPLQSGRPMLGAFAETV